jgi:hypothetical protein
VDAAAECKELVTEVLQALSDEVMPPGSAEPPQPGVSAAVVVAPPGERSAEPLSG